MGNGFTNPVTLKSILEFTVAKNPSNVNCVRNSFALPATLDVTLERIQVKTDYENPITLKIRLRRIQVTIHLTIYGNDIDIICRCE